MLLNFYVDKDELEGLISLFKEARFETFSRLSKDPEVVHEMCSASRKILKALQENRPPSDINFGDEFFDGDSSVGMSVALLNEEAAAMVALVQKLTIVEAETFIKNKKNAKEAINGIWSIRDALKRWWVNIDGSPDQMGTED